MNAILMKLAFIEMDFKLRYEKELKPYIYQ